MLKTYKILSIVVIISIIGLIMLSPGALRLPDPDSKDDRLNKSAVESAFISDLNAERKERERGQVTQRDILSSMAQNHSENMATHGYVGHEQPDGTTIKDRYDDRGLLPECKLKIKNSNKAYYGTENALRLTSPKLINTNVLAENIKRAWMESKPHREAMLVESADEVGLGMEIRQDKLYVALELC